MSVLYPGSAWASMGLTKKIIYIQYHSYGYKWKQEEQVLKYLPSRRAYLPMYPPPKCIDPTRYSGASLSQKDLLFIHIHTKVMIPSVMQDAVSRRNSRTCIVTSHVDGDESWKNVTARGYQSILGFLSTVSGNVLTTDMKRKLQNGNLCPWLPGAEYLEHGMEKDGEAMIHAYDQCRTHGFLVVNNRNRFHASLGKREFKLRIQRFMCKATFETSIGHHCRRIQLQKFAGGKCPLFPVKRSAKAWYYLDCHGTEMTQLPLMKAILQGREKSGQN
ncbi:hypothetical protein DFS33DRAFT_1451924 [Desarmillaria ectypa]|nr:hypothetical protein DFS33DRAFT_1451924 [Desarmillaria ectypa]